MFIIGDEAAARSCGRLYGIKADKVISPNKIKSPADLKHRWRDEKAPIVLLGSPWIHSELVERLDEWGLMSRVVAADRPYEIHKALSSIGAPIEPRALMSHAIHDDFWFRPWFAYPLHAAVAQAERMGLKRLTVLEFGVWEGAGLLNLASLCSAITACTGIEFRVVGFDTGAGLPSVADWRDHPELWHTGELVMPDPEVLKAKLPENCELILGDIKDTLPGFMETLSPEEPLAFFSLDVDTYSSSVDCLKVLDAPAEHLLPATMIYVDDDYINIMQSEFSGEGLAIREFNDAHALRKIARKVVRTQHFPSPWHHAIAFAHIFDHPVRASDSDVNFINLNVHML